MKKIFVIVMILFSTPAWSYLYSSEGNVVGMFAGSGNEFGVFHSASWYNPAGCPNGGGDKAYLLEYSRTQDYSKLTAMIIAAYTAGKKIKIAPSTTVCYAGYPVIERVAFVKGY